MKRSLLICAVILTACAKKEETPAVDTTAMAAPTPTPPPPAAVALTNADMAGTWTGDVMPMGKDTVLTTVTLSATATNDGWTLSLPNGAKPAVKVVAIAGDSVVTETAGFKSAVRKGQNVKMMHQVFHMADGKLTGWNHVTYTNGDTVTLRMALAKK